MVAATQLAHPPTRVTTNVMKKILQSVQISRRARGRLRDRHRELPLDHLDHLPPQERGLRLLQGLLREQIQGLLRERRRPSLR